MATNCLVHFDSIHQGEYETHQLKTLLYLMRNNDYNDNVHAQNQMAIESIEELCQSLYSLDYRVRTIDNKNGELCSTYPRNILIPYDQKAIPEPPQLSATQMREHMKKTKMSRARDRFVCPVLIHNGSFLCRSSTIGCGKDIILQQVGKAIFHPKHSSPSSIKLLDPVNGSRLLDVDYLKKLDIKYICDFMVEDKKVKFGMYVTSSEKVDHKNRYADFDILVMPYPGCETFRSWKKQDYQMEGFRYHLHDMSNSVDVRIPMLLPKSARNVNFNEFRGWDLTKLTVNYLKLIMGVYLEGNKGILLHCISGWDRTPLFVSLVRILLWADGYIHRNLNPHQIMFLTLSYDWFLFGHQLKTRMATDEEILAFCFVFLTHTLHVDDLCMHRFYNDDMNEETLNQAVKDRASKLVAVCKLYHSIQLK